MLVTGSHAASLAAVRAGRADMACIDAVTWHILERDQPEATRDVAVLERTCSAPAPPYVVRKGGEGRAVAHRIAAAMQDVTLKAAREALLLRGVIPVSMDDYDPVRGLSRGGAALTTSYCPTGPVGRGLTRPGAPGRARRRCDGLGTGDHKGRPYIRVGSLPMRSPRAPTKVAPTAPGGRAARSSSPFRASCIRRSRSGWRWRGGSRLCGCDRSRGPAADGRTACRRVPSRCVGESRGPRR
ncbi:MAG: PhnD/SsuA/transferrin family substrate-binding protein [Gammaproteobacteria bacterium]|nr:PhnD/SsuA/transferrin family substrate-binding protein [Gammaproteobacteria bacterium]